MSCVYVRNDYNELIKHVSHNDDIVTRGIGVWPGDRSNPGCKNLEKRASAVPPDHESDTVPQRLSDTVPQIRNAIPCYLGRMGGHAYERC